jgi:signal transduction histidine kinase
LVANAVQAMSQIGKLSIRSYQKENHIIITAADTGVGIPKVIKEKRFALMFSTMAKEQGFGLPVVKRMTESLGGTVSFESQVAKEPLLSFVCLHQRNKR